MSNDETTTATPRLWEAEHPSERALQLAASRKDELDAWLPVFESCRWWEWRKRRRIQALAAGIIADIKRLVAMSARLDGDA